MQRRKIIESEEYQALWPVKLLDDMNTKQKFGNTLNGYFESLSVGSGMTGKQANYLIFDDLLNAEDAHSESKREYANQWFSSTAYNRLQDKKKDKRINVMQRLHEKDLTGHIIENYNFEHLVIPMQKEKGQIKNLLKWKDPRKLGEFIHPERYSQAEKDDEYKGLGEYGWSGQMQQRPVPCGGGIIKEKWIRVEDTSHITLKNPLISVDATFKGGKNSDYVVMTLIGKHKADFIIKDMIRAKMNFTQTLEALIRFEEKWKTHKILIEDKANGPAIIQTLKDKLSGIKAVNPKDSKEARVHACSHLFETGNVILDKNVIQKKDIIKELITFPRASHDDIVDSITQGLLHYKSNTGSGILLAGTPLSSY